MYASSTPRPLQAVAIHPDGKPHFPYQLDDDTVLYTVQPVLPVENARWARVDDDDPRPHVPLDRQHLAELLATASHPGLFRLVRLDADDTELLMAALVQSLAACRCDRDRLDDAHSNPDPLDFAYANRMAACLVAADRLLSAGQGVV